MTLAETILRYDGVLLPPADASCLAGLIKRARQHLGGDLPDDYLDFLRGANGAFVNGLILYPSDSAGWDGLDLPGIVDINLGRRQFRPELSELIILGEMDDDYLVYRPAGRAFSCNDRISLEIWDTAPGLAPLVAGLLEEIG